MIKLNSFSNNEINQKQMRYLCFISILKENFERINQLQKIFLFFKMSNFLDFKLSYLQCQQLHNNLIKQHKSIDNIIQHFSKQLLTTSHQIQYYQQISDQLQQLIKVKMQVKIQICLNTEKKVHICSKKLNGSQQAITEQNQNEFSEFIGSQEQKYAISQIKSKQVMHQKIVNSQFLQNKLGKLERKMIDDNKKQKYNILSNFQNEQKHQNLQNQIFHEYQQYKKNINFQEPKTQNEGQFSENKKQFQHKNKSGILRQNNLYRALNQNYNHQFSFRKYEASNNLYIQRNNIIKQQSNQNNIQNQFILQINENNQIRKDKQIKIKNIWSKEENLRYSIFLKQFKKQFIPQLTIRSYLYSKMSLYLNLSRSNYQCRSHHCKLFDKYGSIEGILKSLQNMISTNFNEVYIKQLTFELHCLAKSDKFTSFYLSNLKYEENLKNQGKQDEEDILVKKQILNRLQNKQTRQNLTSQQKQLINAGNKNGWSFFQNVMFYIGILKNIHTLRCKYRNYRKGIVKDIENYIGTQKTLVQCQDKVRNMRRKTPITEVEIFKILQTKYKLTKDEVQEVMEKKQGYFEILQKKIKLLLEKDQSNKQIPQREI